MHLRSGVVWLALGLAGLSACDAVYANRTGEFNAGPVDPVTFPPDYLGAGGNRLKAGTGKFVAASTYVENARVGVYYFSAPTALRASAIPLNLPASTPRVYAFDANCKAPEGYEYDRVRDDLHYDQQGDIFVRLPEATYAEGSEPTWTFAPVVAEVPVTTTGVECQAIKSERTLIARAQANDGVQVELQTEEEMAAGQKYPLGKTTGKFRAMAIIDPAAAVYAMDGKTSPEMGGLGLQKWGWYGQFMLAYLDGGYIPTDATGAKMVPQNIFIPKQVIVGGKTVTGAIGQGYEVLEYDRSHPSYSPICKVNVYDTGTPMAAADLPKDAEQIKGTYTTFTAPVKEASQKSPVGDTYVYCLQLQ